MEKKNFLYINEAILKAIICRRPVSDIDKGLGVRKFRDQTGCAMKNEKTETLLYSESTKYTCSHTRLQYG